MKLLEIFLIGAFMLDVSLARPSNFNKLSNSQNDMQISERQMNDNLNPQSNQLINQDENDLVSHNSNVQAMTELSSGSDFNDQLGIQQIKQRRRTTSNTPSGVQQFSGDNLNQQSNIQKIDANARRTNSNPQPMVQQYVGRNSDRQSDQQINQRRQFGVNNSNMQMDSQNLNSQDQAGSQQANKRRYYGNLATGLQQSGNGNKINQNSVNMQCYPDKNGRRSSSSESDEWGWLSLFFDEYQLICN
ncbi:CLUMA_CG009536, isoform A [Clunio marinus]|uniref:CLUMA_CG009536, isoform A n=1 Tax=Clunio marinus TaxID=568069 RepID=A0A1J1I964_9DIPT|nr:CLUMA_CG009536, isoform A [Clunio marinus]